MPRRTSRWSRCCADRDTPEPSEELENREMLAYLRDAVHLLPERHRVVVVGYFLEGRKSQDLAVLLGVTESRVSQLRSEALEMLREGIGAQYGAASRRPAARRPRRQAQGRLRHRHRRRQPLARPSIRVAFRFETKGFEFELIIVPAFGGDWNLAIDQRSWIDRRRGAPAETPLPPRAPRRQGTLSVSGLPEELQQAGILKRSAEPRTEP